ncbi:MAG TPA: TetR/AcrR family transcriptional regulator [Longimicrobiaceae bacterium]|nr:TetR/AcrR family transcriptional regulator [Longimicrobiaceae bacterium]
MNASDSETEQRILDAAHAVFLRRGSSGARMQEIADEAGVNKALLHYYFRSKEGLSVAVFHRAAASLFPRIVGILGSELDVEDKVRELVQGYTEFLAGHPYLPGFVISELHYHPERIRQVLAPMGGAPLSQLGAQLETLARAGKLRPIRPEEFMVNLVSLILFPFAARPMIEAVLGLEGERFDAFLEERRRTVADFFLNALRP